MYFNPSNNNYNYPYPGPGPPPPGPFFFPNNGPCPFPPNSNGRMYPPNVIFPCPPLLPHPLHPHPMYPPRNAFLPPPHPIHPFPHPHPEPPFVTHQGVSRDQNRRAIIRELLVAFATSHPWIDYANGGYYDPERLFGREHRHMVLPKDVDAFLMDMGNTLTEDGDPLDDKVVVFHSISDMVHQTTEVTPSHEIPPFAYLKVLYLLFALVEKWDLIIIASKSNSLKSVINIQRLHGLFNRLTNYWSDVIRHCGTSSRNPFLQHIDPDDIRFLKDDLDFEWNEQVKKRLEAALLSSQKETSNKSTNAVAVTATAVSTVAPTPTNQPISNVNPSPSGTASHSTLVRAPPPPIISKPTPRRPPAKPSIRKVIPARPQSSTHLSKSSPKKATLARPALGPPRPELVLPSHIIRVPPIIQERFIGILRKEFRSPTAFNFETWEQNLSSENKLAPKKFIIACHNYEVFFGRRIRLLHQMLDSLDFPVRNDKEVDTTLLWNRLDFIVEVMNCWRILELNDCHINEAQGLTNKFFSQFKRIKRMDKNDNTLLDLVQRHWSLQKMAEKFHDWTLKFSLWASGSSETEPPKMVASSSATRKSSNKGRQCKSRNEIVKQANRNRTPESTSTGRPPPSESATKPTSTLEEIPQIIQDKFLTILKKDFEQPPNFDFESWERSLSAEEKLSPRKFLIACHKFDIYRKRYGLLQKMLNSLSPLINTVEHELHQPLYKIHTLHFIVKIMDKWHVLDLGCSREEAQRLADNFFVRFKLVESSIGKDNTSMKAMLEEVKNGWNSQGMTFEFQMWTRDKFPSVARESGRGQHDDDDVVPLDVLLSTTSTPSPKKRKRIAFVTIDDDEDTDKSSEVHILNETNFESDANEATPGTNNQANKKKKTRLNSHEIEKHSNSNTKEPNAIEKETNNAFIVNKVDESEDTETDTVQDIVITSVFSVSPMCATNQIIAEIPPAHVASIDSSTSSISNAQTSSRRRYSSKKKKFLDRVYKYARDRKLPLENSSVVKDSNFILSGGLVVGNSTGIEPKKRIEVLNALFDWLLNEVAKEEVEVQLKVLFVATHLATHWGILTDRETKVAKATLMRKLWEYYPLVVKRLDMTLPDDIGFHLKLTRLLQKWTDSYLTSFKALTKKLHKTCFEIKAAGNLGIDSNQEKAERLKTVHDLIIDLNYVFVESVESNLSHCDMTFCRHLIENGVRGTEMKKACMWASLGIIPTVKDKRLSSKIAEMVGDFLYSLLKISVLVDPKNADKVALQLLYSWKTSLLKVLSESEMDILLQRIEDESLRSKWKALKLPNEKNFQDFYLSKPF